VARVQATQQNLALPKGSAVADGCDDGCGHDRPDPWDLPYASAARICGGDPFQFEAEHFDLLLDRLPLTPHQIDEVPNLPKLRTLFGLSSSIMGLSGAMIAIGWSVILQFPRSPETNAPALIGK
jgi:hypothetical protein